MPNAAKPNFYGSACAAFPFFPKKQDTLESQEPCAQKGTFSHSERSVQGPPQERLRARARLVSAWPGPGAASGWPVSAWSDASAAL